MDDKRSDVANVLEFSVIAFEPSENPPWRSKDESTSKVQEYPSVQQMITDIVEFQSKAKEVNTVQRNTIQKDFLNRFIFHNREEEEHGVGTLEETVECIKKVESNEKQPKKAPSVADSVGEQETINVYKAFQYLQQQLQAEEECEEDLHGLLESDLIKEIHKIVLEGTANKSQTTSPGEYSTQPRFTIFKGVKYDYPHHHPNPKDMDREVNKIIDRYNSLIDDLKGDSDDTSRILKLFKTSSWLLFELLDLHPFADGNGRLCRLLCNYALSVFTPFPTPIYNIWSKSSKDDYRQALVDARQSSSRHPKALTTMLIECNWLAWTEFYRRVEQAN